MKYINKSKVELNLMHSTLKREIENLNIETNRFNLIFRLSIRKRMYSDTEVLRIQDLTINKQGLAEDEKLEHAMIYQTSLQENLFDLFDSI